MESRDIGNVLQWREQFPFLEALVSSALRGILSSIELGRSLVGGGKRDTCRISDRVWVKSEIGIHVPILPNVSLLVGPLFRMNE